MIPPRYKLQGFIVEEDVSPKGVPVLFEATGSGDTVDEFLSDLVVVAVDEDGGEHGSLAFDDLPVTWQTQILRRVGIEWDEVHAVWNSHLDLETAS